MMGIKECTCDEYQVLYGSVESVYCTPEIIFSFILIPRKTLCEHFNNT